MTDQLSVAQIRKILKRQRLMGNLAVKLGVSVAAVSQTLSGKRTSAPVLEAARRLALECLAKEQAA